MTTVNGSSPLFRMADFRPQQGSTGVATDNKVMTASEPVSALDHAAPVQDVDMEKVAAAKARLLTGNQPFDPVSLSDRIVKYHGIDK